MKTPDVLTPELVLTRASTEQRLANLSIDIVFFYGLIFVFSLIVALIFPSPADDGASDDVSAGLVGRTVYIICYALYMSIVESVFNGKSLGKLITRTRAVNLKNGSKISTGTAFARGFCRAIPFSLFSAFGTPCIPWHDEWTDTLVVDEKSSTLLWK